MQFTREQQSVIDDRGHNLLVSAAAGSGKTAVLVERIIRRVCDMEDKIDIDRLLVMTFTKAAAAEMKQRLQAKLDERLYESDAATDSALRAHIHRQSSLIRGAHISTIDGFCSSVLRNNFNAIGLDPSFRVADEGELKLLRAEVMEELLESEYEAGERTFTEFVEAFCPGNSDRAAEELIQKLYDFSQSKPDPAAWLALCTETYRAESVSELFEKPVMKSFYEGICGRIEEIRKNAELALEIAKLPDGPYMYIDLLEREKAAIERISERAQSVFSDAGELMDELRELLMAVVFERLPGSRRDMGIDASKKDLAKGLRDKNKTAIKKLLGDCFYTGAENMLSEVNACAGHAAELVRLTLRFSDMYLAAKRERRLVDFSDLEHFTLDVLYEHDDEGKRTDEPSDIAGQYRELFYEIYVDEYQDSNEVQEEILRAIARREPEKGNLFMVGDVKQSIYRFRLASPKLFMEKNNTYTVYDPDKNNTTDDTINNNAENTRDRRIDLHKNFRSRQEVLDTVNFIFDLIMKKEVGGVEYDANARLVLGAGYPDKTQELSDAWDSELMLILPDEELDKRELEAAAVAVRIRELMKHQLVMDEGSGELRAARYGDIAVLLRTTAGWENVFKRTLEQYGIPAYSESKSGYFSGYEVRSLLDMLTVIDNPRNDEVLCAVLKGYFGRVTDEELARIRIAYPEDRFYTAVMKYARWDDNDSDQTAPDKDLQEKLQKLLDLRERYADMSSYIPVSELISLLMYDESLGGGCFALSVRAMDRGQVRVQNLGMLQQRAAEYEGGSYKGLFSFVKYIEQLKRYEIDFGQSQSVSEDGDAVKIMSVHKSKGLEFPVCIVAGLGKDFNQMDARGSLLMDAQGGIGMDFVDTALRTKRTTVIKKALAEEIKKENLGEELRIFYVALTRAREKLIMSTLLDKRQYKKMIENNTGADMGLGVRGVSREGLLSGRSYADWLTDIVCSDFRFNRLLKSITEEKEDYDTVKVDKLPLKVNIINSKMLILEQVDTSVVREELKAHYMDILKNTGDISNRTGSEKCYNNIYDKKFSWSYKNSTGKNNNIYVPLKASVSKLKHEAMEEPDAVRLAEEYDDYVNPDAAEALINYVNQPQHPAKTLVNYVNQPQQPPETSSDYVNQPQRSPKERPDILSNNNACNPELPEEPVPDFIKKLFGEDVSEAPLIGSLRGSAYHRFFELLDYSGDLSAAGIKTQIEHFRNKGFLDAKQAQVLNPEDFVRFIKTSVGERMGAAFRRGTLKREQPFCIAVNADSVNTMYPHEEKILIQGIIDALFIEDGEYVIVDYKTDNVKEPEHLVDLYRVQLLYYARAITQITGVNTKECIIYSVKHGCEVKVR